MKFINIEQFIKTLTLETIKDRIYTVQTVKNTDMICNIFYKLDNGYFLQLTSFERILKDNQVLTNKALKSFGSKRNLSFVDFNKTINKCYAHPEKYGFVIKCEEDYYEDDDYRIFEPFSRFVDNDIKLEKFNEIPETYPEKPHYKHVTYRGDSVWAKIVKIGESGSIKCKIYDYDTLEHIGYTNLNNLNG